jgi:spore protease
VPVIAIGVPTVVHAATIVKDTMTNLLDALAAQGMTNSYHSLNEVEQVELVRELLTPHLNTLYVTGKDIDGSVNRLSATIAEGINLAFS